MCVTANDTPALQSAHSGKAKDDCERSHDRKTADSER